MDCASYPKCSAPIYPKHKETIKNSIWFPNEEICCSKFKNKATSNLIKIQKKIKERAKDLTKCYSYKMLSQNCIIGKAIKGIDPDKDQEVEEKKWLKKHPAKKAKSEEEIEKLKRRAVKMRAGSSSKSCIIRKKPAIR